MNIISLLFTSPVGALVLLFSIVVAVTFHEFAHAWTAYRLGDDTPYLQGRVTLNPAAHLDPVGSVLFVLFGIGWGKPVLYNPMRLSRRSDELLIALAGPASNILLAILLNALAALLSRAGGLNPAILIAAADINVLLAAFNMVPIPPLDGSSIIAYFWPEYRSLTSSQIGIVILLILILPLGSSNLLGMLLGPVESVFRAAAHLFGLIPYVGASSLLF